MLSGLLHLPGNSRFHTFASGLQEATSLKTSTNVRDHEDAEAVEKVSAHAAPADLGAAG